MLVHSSGMNESRAEPSALDDPDYYWSALTRSWHWRGDAEECDWDDGEPNDAEDADDAEEEQ